MTATARARLSLAARVLLPIYLVVLCWIVFSQSDESTNATGLVAWVFEVIDELHASFEPAYVAIEFVANIALFVPFGVLVRLAFARLPWWAIGLLGFATTVTIELVQITLPSRFSTVSDVVANTLGTGLGLLAVWAFSRRG